MLHGNLIFACYNTFVINSLVKIYEAWTLQSEQLFYKHEFNNFKFYYSTQKIAEERNTLPDKCSDIPQTSQTIKEESSKDTQQKIENYVIKDTNDTETLNSGTTKSKMLLKLIKGIANRKTKQTEQNDALTVKKLANIPSLDNLDSLDLSSDSTIDTYTKKTRTNLFNKFRKKGQIKKIPVQVR